MGWHTADDSWWPVISEMLTGKWPREAALMDLRWHGDRRNHTGEPMPGRRALGKRWSWKPGAVRGLMTGGEWIDPAWKAQSPGANPPIAHPSPGANPVLTHPEPAASSANAGNGAGHRPPIAHPSPGANPPIAHPSPTNRPPFRDTHSTQHTAHSPTPTPEEAEVSPSATAEQDLFGSGGLVQGDPPPTSPPPVKPAVLSETETPPALPALTAAAGKRTKKTGVDYDLFNRLAELWAHEAFLSKGNRTTRAPQLKFKSSEGTKAILGMLKAGVTEEDFGRLFKRHWHGSDDFNRVKGNGLKTIAKYHERYLERALDEETGMGPKPSTARKGANAHDFNDLSDLEPTRGEWIDGEVIDRHSTQGGPHGR